MNNSQVIITRPEKQARVLVDGLAKLGRQCVVFSMFEIEPMQDVTALDKALSRLSDFALVVFVSPNAIDAAFGRLSYLKGEWPADVALGVMGVASKLALARHGLDEENSTIFSPLDLARTDSETLFSALDLASLRGKKVLIIRGESGRDFLSDSLVANGTQVEQLSAYRRVLPSFNMDKKRQLAQLLSDQNDWLITSSEVLKTLVDWSSQLDIDNAVAKMQQQRLFVPHFRIAENAHELGFESVILSASGDENLLLALQSQL